MTNIRGISSTRGSVLDLPHALSLSATDCNVLLVSSRTLFFIQQFGIGEMTFRSRYASEFLDGARYVIAETAAELDDINDIVNLYGLEVVEVSSDIVGAINGVQQAILTATSNACACGTVGETIEATSGTPGGTPPPGFGEPDLTIVNRRCKAANAIHDSMVNVITDLEATPVEGFLALGFGVVAGLASATIATAFIPVVGQLVVAVAGAVVAVTLALLAAGLDLTSLKAELIASADDLVCALVEAGSAQGAKDAYGQVLTDAGQSVVNVGLISALMTVNTVDLLYFSTPDSEAFLDTFVPAIDCSLCGAPIGEWIISPDGFKSINSVGGVPLGTGIIDQGGGVFSISSVPIDGSSNHVVSIQVNGYNNVPGITSILGSDVTLIELDPDISSPTNLRERQGIGCGDPLIVSSSTEGGNMPETLSGNLAFWYILIGPFDMILSIDTSPVICP